MSRFRNHNPLLPPCRNYTLNKDARELLLLAKIRAYGILPSFFNSTA
jgi:hypothetical protein